MKLSTAIIKGAKLRPQAFASPLSETVEGSCAIAAALEVVGGSIERARRLYCDGKEVEFFPVLDLPAPPCPAEGCKGSGYENFEGVIFHLNDIHRWTRERIAKWVAGIEKANA